MYDIVTVDEGMIRLSPPCYERIRRAKTFDVHVCGSQGKHHHAGCSVHRDNQKGKERSARAVIGHFYK